MIALELLQERPRPDLRLDVDSGWINCDNEAYINQAVGHIVLDEAWKRA